MLEIDLKLGRLRDLNYFSFTSALLNTFGNLGLFYWEHRLFIFGVKPNFPMKTVLLGTFFMTKKSRKMHASSRSFKSQQRLTNYHVGFYSLCKRFGIQAKTEDMPLALSVSGFGQGRIQMHQMK